jgi:hypothetical protein
MHLIMHRSFHLSLQMQPQRGARQERLQGEEALFSAFCLSTFCFTHALSQIRDFGFTQATSELGGVYSAVACYPAPIKAAVR